MHIKYTRFMFLLSITINQKKTFAHKSSTESNNINNIFFWGAVSTISAGTFLALNSIIKIGRKEKVKIQEIEDIIKSKDLADKLKIVYIDKQYLFKYRNKITQEEFKYIDLSSNGESLSAGEYIFQEMIPEDRKKILEIFEAIKNNPHFLNMFGINDVTKFQNFMETIEIKSNKLTELENIIESTDLAEKPTEVEKLENIIESTGLAGKLKIVCKNNQYFFDYRTQKKFKYIDLSSNGEPLYAGEYIFEEMIPEDRKKILEIFEAIKNNPHFLNMFGINDITKFQNFIKTFTSLMDIEHNYGLADKLKIVYMNKQYLFKYRITQEKFKYIDLSSINEPIYRDEYILEEMIPEDRKKILKIYKVIKNNAHFLDIFGINDVTKFQNSIETMEIKLEKLIEVKKLEDRIESTGLADKLKILYMNEKYFFEYRNRITQEEFRYIDLSSIEETTYAVKHIFEEMIPEDRKKILEIFEAIKNNPRFLNIFGINDVTKFQNFMKAIEIKSEEIEIKSEKPTEVEKLKDIIKNTGLVDKLKIVYIDKQYLFKYRNKITQEEFKYIDLSSNGESLSAGEYIFEEMIPEDRKKILEIFEAIKNNSYFLNMFGINDVTKFQDFIEIFTSLMDIECTIHNFDLADKLKIIYMNKQYLFNYRITQEEFRYIDLSSIEETTYAGKYIIKEMIPEDRKQISKIFNIIKCNQNFLKIFNINDSDRFEKFTKKLQDFTEIENMIENQGLANRLKLDPLSDSSICDYTLQYKVKDKYIDLFFINNYNNAITFYSEAFQEMSRNKEILSKLLRILNDIRNSSLILGINDSTYNYTPLVKFFINQLEGIIQIEMYIKNTETELKLNYNPINGYFLDYLSTESSKNINLFRRENGTITCMVKDEDRNILLDILKIIQENQDFRKSFTIHNQKVTEAELKALVDTI